VPPTESRGRVHTSAVTVAILDINQYKEIDINPNEIRMETTRGNKKAGGQHQNSTDSCVVVIHIPTGIKVVRQGRHQTNNKIDALNEVKKRINDYYRTGYLNEASEIRKEQVGDGTRSDKRRTYRVKDGIVIDHITNKTASVKDIFKGRINLLA